MYWSEPDIIISSSSWPCEEELECMHTISGNVCTKCRCVVSSFESGGEWNAMGFPRAPEKGSYAGILKTFSEKPNLRHFDQAVVSKVASFYEKAVSESGSQSVLRCNRREGVIAACLEKVLHERGEYKPSRYFIDLFGIKAKAFSDGQTLVASSTGTVISPKIHELVRTYAQQLGLPPSDVSKGEAFAMALHKSAKAFNTSAPNSVAAALLYAFVENNPRVLKTLPGFSKDSFGARVQISPATIANLVGVVNGVLGKA